MCRGLEIEACLDPIRAIILWISHLPASLRCNRHGAVPLATSQQSRSSMTERKREQRKKRGRRVRLSENVNKGKVSSDDLFFGAWRSVTWFGRQLLLCVDWQYWWIEETDYCDSHIGLGLLLYTSFRLIPICSISVIGLKNSLLWQFEPLLSHIYSCGIVLHLVVVGRNAIVRKINHLSSLCSAAGLGPGGGGGWTGMLILESNHF